MIKGVSVSPGVAIARVYRLDEAMAQQNPTVLDPAALPAEVSRFENAVAAVAAELGTVVERVAREVGEDEAAIFRAHRRRRHFSTACAAIAALSVQRASGGMNNSAPSSATRHSSARLPTPS